MTKSFAYYTPYQFAANRPIVAIDLDGLETDDTVPEMKESSYDSGTSKYELVVTEGTASGATIPGKNDANNSLSDEAALKFLSQISQASEVGTAVDAVLSTTVTLSQVSKMALESGEMVTIWEAPPVLSNQYMGDVNTRFTTDGKSLTSGEQQRKPNPSTKSVDAVSWCSETAQIGVGFCLRRRVGKIVSSGRAIR